MVATGGLSAAATGAHAAPTSPSKTRLRDLREDARTRVCQAALVSDTEQRQQQRALRFHGRWHHVRAFYATTTERVPQHKRKIWLRLLAGELHDGIVGFKATMAQMESCATTALQSMVGAQAAWKEVLHTLQAVVLVFQREDASVIDYRELLCACVVLDQWRDGELRMLMLWMDEYSLPMAPVGDMGIRTADVALLLHTPCAGTADEQALAPFVARIINSTKGWVRVVDIKRFTEETPAFSTLLKELCWRRLIDDQRLGFFRDVYRQAMDRVEKEESHVRLVAAMQLWRLREPRARLMRWKDFVYTRKLMHRGDTQFATVSHRKIVRRFQANRDRKQQMRRSLVDAKRTHERSLVRWTLQAWLVLCRSMLEIHRAAWCRSVDHHHAALSTRVWRAYVVFTIASRDEKARRRVLVDKFMARRHHQILKESWHEWMFVYRRQKELRGAAQLERQLHADIEEKSRQEAEQIRMAIEDAISQAVELKERELQELAKRRAFQEATDRVYANRKLKQQEEERRQFKQAREERILAEMDDAWGRIRERVSAEVRVATLVWFSTSEGTKAIHTEATEIFERDPIATQKALIQDPQAFALPGCLWQLRLEDYGGRFAKAFYLNTETLEKFVCDELVMDNCEVIAKEVLIQRRIDDARERLRLKASELDQDRQRHAAALKIQMLFRCRHALLIARSKIRTGFIKRIEPTTGDVVYFNIAKQETRRRPPRLIGRDEPLIPTESSTWVRRVDDDGNDYYEQRETGETSWTPPPHHFLCVRCKHGLATRRWNETGARFCIACYADGLRKKLFVPVATWTKLSVQPAKCVVCRNAPVVVLCHECRGDATCESCWRAVHRNPKCASHTQMDYLVYT